MITRRKSEVHSTVDSEDGTLLIGDATVLRLWLGSDSENEQRNLIVRALDEERHGFIVNIHQQTAVLWNLEGPGTVDVYSEPDGTLSLVRSWFDEDEDPDELGELASLPYKGTNKFGEFTIHSGYLALFWSGETGNCIHRSEDEGFYIRPEEMTTTTSGLVVPIAKGMYGCFHDEVTVVGSEARRCHIVRNGLRQSL